MRLITLGSSHNIFKKGILLGASQLNGGMMSLWNDGIMSFNEINQRQSMFLLDLDLRLDGRLRGKTRDFEKILELHFRTKILTDLTDPYGSLRIFFFSPKGSSHKLNMYTFIVKVTFQN